MNDYDGNDIKTISSFDIFTRFIRRDEWPRQGKGGFLPKVGVRFVGQAECLSGWSQKYFGVFCVEDLFSPPSVLRAAYWSRAEHLDARLR